jgi:hypothetical protein
VEFDRFTAESPYEERSVLDEEQFATLADRVRGITDRWGFVPLLDDFWGEARRQAARTPLLGERLVAARRALERRWGCHNLELPVSRLCQTEPYAVFACHLLAHLPRFHAAYNGCVQDYRRRHSLRSRHHPVPDLAADGDWLEVPFWAWRTGGGRRGRLFARQRAGAAELRVGGETWPAVPLDAPRGVAAWRDLERRGLKVRSRALTNTLFARLFLADLFVHGIGGGKYDEVTDDLARRFYGVELPGYLVLSGTLLLPLPAYPADAGGCRRLARRLRDLTFNPQHHLDAGAGVEPWIREKAEEKQRWIGQQPPTRRERRRRFRELRRLTAELAPAVAADRHAAAAELERCEQEVRANELLRRRDYAFCLYPEPLLRRFIAAGTAATTVGPAVPRAEARV